MGSTRPNPTHVNWVGLDLCDELGWVEFFLTYHDGLGQKIPSTLPNPTHAHPYQVPPQRFSQQFVCEGLVSCDFSLITNFF